MIAAIREFITRRKRLAAVVADMENIKRAQRPRYIEIQRFGENDQVYVDALSIIAQSPALRFFLYEAREAIIERMENIPAADKEAIAESCAEIKALGKIRQYLENSIAASAALRAKK
jgi:hypothetical protein